MYPGCDHSSLFVVCNAPINVNPHPPPPGHYKGLVGDLTFKKSNSLPMGHDL